MPKQLQVKGRPDRVIIGTADIIECCAVVHPDAVSFNAEGGIDVEEYIGDTRVYWDTQVQKKDERGVPLWQAEDGTEWPEDMLELVDVEG